jgi:hypothetical protein
MLPIPKQTSKEWNQNFDENIIKINYPSTRLHVNFVDNFLREKKKRVIHEKLYKVI